MQLFTICVETQFKASHCVALPDGSIEPEHEHFWAISVEVSRNELDEKGLVVGFSRLKAALGDISSQLTGSVLNDVDYFRDKGATAESMSVYIFERLEPKLPKDVRLVCVTVSEQVGCWARYSKNQ